MSSTLSQQILKSEAEDRIDAFLEPIDSLLNDGEQAVAYRLLKILQSQAKRQWVEERLRSIHQQSVPGWHFNMLNDVKRGQVYADALSLIDVRDRTVLDIGAGSGLLSMIAVRCGARHVYACEMVQPIAEKAKEIVRQNGMADRITIIPKSSFEARVGEEMPERAQVMVSETLDYGFVGEGFLSSLRHAKKNLLGPDATLIPCGMKLCGVLIESSKIHYMNHVSCSQGFDVSALNEFSRSYFPVRLGTYPHRILSDIRILVEENLYAFTPESIRRTIEFEATENGTVHGVAFWFEVTLAPGVTLSNGLDQPASHWTQAFSTFCQPLSVKKGRSYSVELTLTEQSVNIVPL